MPSYRIRVTALSDVSLMFGFDLSQDLNAAVDAGTIVFNQLLVVGVVTW